MKSQKTPYLNNAFRFIVSLLTFACLHLPGNGQVWQNGRKLASENEYSDFVFSVNPITKSIIGAGEYTNQISFGNFTVNSKGDKDIFIVEFDSSFAPLRLSSIGSTGKDLLGDIHVSDKGELFLTGYYTDSITLDNYTLTSKGGLDFYVVKMNSSYDVLWAKTYGSSVDDTGELGIGGITLDHEGSIYTLAYFSDDWDPQPLDLGDTLLYPNGARGGFLMKHDSDGTLIWITTIVGKRGIGISTDLSYLNGKLFFTANSSGSIHFDGTNYSNPYGGGHGVAFCINSNSGNKEWHQSAYLREFGTIGLISLNVDSLGNIYFVGRFNTERLEVAGRTVNNTFNLYGLDVFVGKLDSTGKLAWLELLRGGATDAVTDITVVSKNRIYVTGSYTERCYYRGDTIGYLGQNGKNGYVLEIDSNGAPVYFSSVGNNGSSQVTRLLPYDKDQIIISGYSGPGTFTFDGILEFNFQGNYNNFIATGNTDSVALSNTSILQRSLRLYPNPSSNISYCDNPFSQGVTNLTIVDAMGKIMISKEVSTRSIPIPVKQWASGLYEIILTNTHSNQTYHAKLFKN